MEFLFQLNLMQHPLAFFIVIYETSFLAELDTASPCFLISPSFLHLFLLFLFFFPPFFLVSPSFYFRTLLKSYFKKQFSFFHSFIPFARTTRTCDIIMCTPLPVPAHTSPHIKKYVLQHPYRSTSQHKYSKIIRKKSRIYLECIPKGSTFAPAFQEKKALIK